jgi:hypothetical protein
LLRNELGLVLLQKAKRMQCWAASAGRTDGTECPPLNGYTVFLYSIYRPPMFVHITPMRFHGKALDQHQIRTAESLLGNIIVSHQNVTVLGRYSDVATVQTGRGGQDSLLPALYDCRLAHMGTNGFVLSGLQLEGAIAFAQGWWCRQASQGSGYSAH